MLDSFLRWRCAAFHKIGLPLFGCVTCKTCGRRWPVLEAAATHERTEALLERRRGEHALWLQERGQASRDAQELAQALWLQRRGSE